jgi:hypothetical protein
MKSWAFSFTISSLVFPPPTEAYLGRVSIIVKIISTDSFILKVRSALESKPKTSGESTGGIVEIY